MALSSTYERPYLGSPSKAQRCSINQTIVAHLNGTYTASQLELNDEVGYQLEIHDLERLSRYHNRTLASSGLHQAGVICQKESMRLMATVSAI